MIVVVFTPICLGFAIWGASKFLRWLRLRGF